MIGLYKIIEKLCRVIILRLDAEKTSDNGSKVLGKSNMLKQIGNIHV
jgi:hypothetical protein